jgi:hypothetical protein
MQNTCFPKVWKSKMGLRGFKEIIGEQLRKKKEALESCPKSC